MDKAMLILIGCGNAGVGLLLFFMICMGGVLIILKRNPYRDFIILPHETNAQPLGVLGVVKKTLCTRQVQRSLCVCVCICMSQSALNASILALQAPHLDRPLALAVSIAHDGHKNKIILRGRIVCRHYFLFHPGSARF